MQSYVIKSDLSERQIEADVATYLGWCSMNMPFRLLDVDEQATGADRLFDVTVPIYLQFKKSLGLQPLKANEVKRRLNESALQRIRRFRQRHGLADDPSLFFQLRAKAEGAADFQHNVLLAHHQPCRSYAVYVAPLYLDRQVYYEELCRGPRYQHDPWMWRETKILDAWGMSTWLSRYDRQPFLRNHVTISPHERVASHNHFYAYSPAGDEISWHSPSIIDGGPFRLSDFMTQRTRELLLGETRLPTAEDGLGVATAVLSEMGIGVDTVLRGESSFDRLRSYGRWLRETFRIRQILICGRSDHLKELRGFTVA